MNPNLGFTAIGCLDYIGKADRGPPPSLYGFPKLGPANAYQRGRMELFCFWPRGRLLELNGVANINLTELTFLPRLSRQQLA